MWTFDPQHPNGRINLGSEGAFWEHSFKVIPTHDKYAFDGVKLRLELGPEVWKIQRNWVTVAAVGALVLGGFAIRSRWPAPPSVATSRRRTCGPTSPRW